MPDPADRRHLLTVNLEDYFQVGAFNRYVQKRQWYRFESRLAVTADKTLDLLDKHGAKATFFVLGWVADNYPDVVRRVAERGHEIASRGYYHRSVSGMTPEEFRKDLARAKAALERVSGRAVVGYRTADGWLKPDDAWALDVLADEGYAYDSSVAPIGRAYAAEPWKRFLHDHRRGLRKMSEVPVSAARVLGHDLPIGGGNWIRQLPPAIMRRLADRWVANAPTPLVLYFHTWELDEEQPRLSSAGWLTRVRHYRNLAKMPERIGGYLDRYQFTTVADYLNVPRPAVNTIADLTITPAPTALMPKAAVPSGPRTPVTIAVPVFNEELLVPYLANTLAKVRTAFAPAYDLKFVIVDDGSSDATWDGLTHAFGKAADVRLERHAKNRGVAAAILTGIRAADTEIVCSMDADCTYDPFQFLEMIPKLTDGVDMVTASPYHPQGAVRNVPGWRLVLSKGASKLYRRLLHNRLSTYTSCFRVYRRSSVMDLPVRHGNFLGVVELLGRLDLRGGKVLEHPATLEVRMLGRSKMKTLRTIWGHLKLMASFARARVFGSRRRGLTAQERDRALTMLMSTAANTPCHAALSATTPAPTVALVVAPREVDVPVADAAPSRP